MRLHPLQEALRREQARDPNGSRRWLALGTAAARALKEALPGAERVRRVVHVHSALAALTTSTFDGCLVEARRLRPRPALALALLRERVGDGALLVLDAPKQRGVRRAAAALGIPLCRGETEAPAPQPEPAAPAPAPRADGASPGASAVHPERFAASCLPRLGSLRSLLDHVLRTVVEITSASRVSLMLLEARRPRLRLRRAWGLDASFVGHATCRLGRPVAGSVAAMGRPVAGLGRREGRPGRAFVVLPLGSARRPLGVINVTGLPDDDLPDRRTLGRWARIGRHAGRAIEASRRLRRAETLSNRDALTGLANRRAFHRALTREMARATRAGRGLGVAMLDLDRFKDVNDRFGHAAGDRVLVEVARRLGRALRESDLVARWGGEEFAILLPDLESEAAATSEGLEGALERARRGVGARPVDLGSGRERCRVTVSAGLATFPRDGADASTLLQRADEALYRAKEAGRDTLRTT